MVATHHTIERDEEIRVTLADGRTVAATLAGHDAGTDLAVLRLEGAGDVPPAQPDGETDLRPGTLVLAVGRPGTDITCSLGVISSAGGEFRTWSGGRVDRLVRLDLAIYDGFSGGPLVDARGRVLGINTSALARGAPLTIPASTVARVADQLLERGHIRRGYLGVAMQPVPLPDELRQRLGLPGEVGLMLVSVEPPGSEPGSPLTPREIEVLGMLAEGAPNRRIARKLGISDHTVKAHLAAIFAKLGASTRTEGVAISARRGLVML